MDAINLWIDGPDQVGSQYSGVVADALEDFGRAAVNERGEVCDQRVLVRVRRSLSPSNLLWHCRPVVSLAKRMVP
jgi:hypothetical protein